MSSQTSSESAAIAHPYSADIDLALELAVAADVISMRRFLASDLHVETKPDLTPVTEADQAVERKLRDLIAVARPDDIVAGEEYGGFTDGKMPPGRVWVIDPIDGTKNYVRGVPVWATLIALVVDGDPVVGVVSAPALGRRWWGSQGGSAWTASAIPGLDTGQPRKISVSAVSDMRDASVSYSDQVAWPEGAFERLTDDVWRTRAYGDFYSHLLVAEGAVDIAAEPELSLWDIAALVPIVEAAGGKVTGFDNTAALLAGNALSTNGRIHDQAIARVSS